MVEEEDDDGGVNPCVMIGAVVARMHTNVDRGLIFFLCMESNQLQQF